MILAIIGIMKNYVSKRTAFPAVAMGIMVLWAVVSLIKGCDLSISMYGYPNRGEGLLAIIFYFCFFVTAMCIKREKGLRTILDGIVGVGVLNSIIALVQIFTGELGHYKYISLQLCVNAASGLSMSPLFLAMVLTLSLTAALIGFVTSDCKKRRTILLVISAVFSFIMMFTYSFIGVCGLAFAVIAAFAAVFVMKAPKSRLACIPVSIVSAAAAVALVYSGAIGNISSYSLYDGRILWFQDGYSRASASGMYNPDVIDIDNTADVYLYMNSRTMDIIEHNPLFGTGPDQLAFEGLLITGEHKAVVAVFKVCEKAVVVCDYVIRAAVMRDCEVVDCINGPFLVLGSVPVELPLIEVLVFTLCDIEGNRNLVLAPGRLRCLCGKNLNDVCALRECFKYLASVVAVVGG